MRPVWIATSLVPLMLVVSGVLQACGPSQEEKREAAELARRQQQARADLQRCRRDQAAVKRLTDKVQRHAAELTRLNGERYEPAPRPEPPDPALAARFTQEDRELDELRYRERLRHWEASEQQRYGRWMAEQDARRSQLRIQLQSDAALLRRLAPQLMAAAGGSALNPQAVGRAVRCDPTDFGLQNSAAAGSSSRAAAN